MGDAGTVAVLLPGAYYLLRETQCPPVELFRKHHVAMAIASDANPGTSPALSLRLMINMACTLFRLTPEEALAGVTTTQPKRWGCNTATARWKPAGGGLCSPKAVAAGGTGLLVGRPAALYGDFPRRSTSMTIRDPFSFQSGSLPLLISIPHAGTQLTPAVEAGLTDDARPLPDTDWHIPQLYDFARAMGASVLVGNYSRFVIDLNRPADDKPLYTTATTGLYPDVLFDGRPLPAGQSADGRRTRRLSAADLATLSSAAARRTAHARTPLFDAHSIASVIRGCSTASCRISTSAPTAAKAAPGREAIAGRLLRSSHPRAERPLQGGYITRAYGQPQQQQHAIQLELAQMNYMSEQYPYAFEPQRAASLQRLLKQMIEGLLDGAAKLN